MASPANEASPLVVKDYLYRDNVKEMTWGRRLARYLSQYKWYNPQLNNPNAPSIDEAWAYFEHVTLARHFKPDECAVDVNRKAEVGEDEAPTKLYSVLGTPESDLGDFGIGVGMYFYTLRLLAVIMLVAGVINIPNLLFFYSNTYNPSNERLKKLSLKASAICTTEAWAACPTCTKGDWDQFPQGYDRYAEVTSNDGSVLTFIKVNMCDIDKSVGFVAYASLIFICFAIFTLQKAVTREQIKLDNASLTTTDYAVEVRNPPKDARDPNEWKSFFQQFGHVASITVALDNEELLRALLRRRQYVMMLEDLQPSGLKVDHVDIKAAVAAATPLTLVQKMMLMSDGLTIKRKIDSIDKKIATDLSKRDYKVSNVFVIFEREADQTRALQAMSVGGIHVMTNNTSALPQNLRFRGQHVLRVCEPQEPSSVRWQDLDEHFVVQIVQRLLTFVLTMSLIITSCFLVVHVRNNFGTAYAAMTISATNSMFPTICLYITDVESHRSEGSRQASYYFKITAALWILTTILTAYLTPFTDTLDDSRVSLIPAMYAIFITELLKNPITKVLDIQGNFYRHVFAPRAPDQRRMNAYFSGLKYHLSERYSDMTNVLFVTFYFAMIYPAGFFWAAATLSVHYWVDKFCLLRNWAPAPALGTDIADLSRVYFFSAAVVVYAIMSSYNFASFPYDNACNLNQTVPSDYVGSFSGQTADGTTVQFSISEGDKVFKYCNQDMLRYKPWPAFPAVPASQPNGSEWMGQDQEFTFVFGWTSVVVIAFVVLLHLNVARKCLSDFFFGGFVSQEKPPSKGFTESTDIYGYIPQFKLKGALFPTLLCDVNLISDDLIDWHDPSDPSKKLHNAIYDVPGLLKANEAETILSMVKEWLPEKSSIIMP